MSKEMAIIVDKSKINHIDEWGTDAYPIQECDRIYKNIKGEIILPLAEFFHYNSEEAKQLNYFSMNSKRAYNSDKIRDHICQYLNYFEKFYDKDKQLIAIINELKIIIDYTPNYTLEAFINDINQYIIRDPDIIRKIRNMVHDNYSLNLSDNGGKTPNLQFTNKHAKLLLELSILTNIYIPLATHYMFIHYIKDSTEIQNIMLWLFDMCNARYVEMEGVDLYNKVYETAASVVNKSKNPDKPLWEKNLIRGNNTTTHTKDSVYDVILQIIPKYTFTDNIINFNYFSNRQSLKYKITDIAYEMNFSSLSPVDRDADMNSEFDKFEAKTNKKDESMWIDVKVAAEHALKTIIAKYGPIEDDEVEHYRKALTKNGSQIINPLTNKLVKYTFCEEFGDPEIWKYTPSVTDYIKLIIAAKRKFINYGMTILPYVISSRINKITTKKSVSKCNTIEITNAALYRDFQNKYKNPNVEKIWFELLGTIKSSDFEIIDWDTKNHCPTINDGVQVPFISDIFDEELLNFAIII